MGRLDLLGGQINLVGGQMPTQLTCNLPSWLPIIVPVILTRYAFDKDIINSESTKNTIYLFLVGLSLRPPLPLQTNLASARSTYDDGAKI